MKHVYRRTIVLTLTALTFLLVAPTQAAPTPRDSSQFQQGRIQALQAEIKALEESIKVLERDLKVAVEDLDRTKRNQPKAPKPGATQADKDKYNHQQQAWQAQVNAAQKKVDMIKSDLAAKRAQRQMKLTELKKLLDAQKPR